MSFPANLPSTTILCLAPPIIDLSLSNGATTSGFAAVVPIPSPINAVVGPVTKPPSAKAGIKLLKAVLANPAAAAAITGI